MGAAAAREHGEGALRPGPAARRDKTQTARVGTAKTARRQTTTGGAEFLSLRTKQIQNIHGYMTLFLSFD